MLLCSFVPRNLTSSNLLVDAGTRLLLRFIFNFASRNPASPNLLEDADAKQLKE